MRHLPWRYFHGLEWSPDGRWLAFSDKFEDSSRNTLHLVSLATGARRVLLRPEEGVNYQEPAFSPDGRQLAFTRYREGVSDLATVDLTPDGIPGAVVPVNLPGFTSAMNTTPRWTPDGRNLLFRSTRTSIVGQLWTAPFRPNWLQKSGPHLLAPAGQYVHAIAVSPRTGQIAITKRVDDTNPYEVVLKGPNAGAERPLNRSTWLELNGSYSPDGSKIAFESNRTGFFEIWISDADGGNAVALTNMQGPGVGSPSWSPDGRYIAFDTRRDGQPEIYIMEARQNAPMTRITNNGAVDMLPCWSGDGRWIYFNSDRTGITTVWRVPSGGGAAEQVMHWFAISPRTAPDSTAVYYTADDLVLWRFVPGSQPERIAAAAGNRAFSATRGGVYYLKNVTAAGAELRLYRTSTRTSTLVRKVSGPVQRAFSVSPDESRAMIYRLDASGSDLFLHTLSR